MGGRPVCDERYAWWRREHASRHLGTEPRANYGRLVRFLRLESLLGTPIEALGAEALRRAVDDGVPEDADLDWKRDLYAPTDKGRQELAKDVAALANSVGGVIVLGVAERDGRAAKLAPVPLGEREQLRVRQVLAERVRPFLPGVVVRPVPAEPATPEEGFWVVAVPRSPDAPHAVVMERALGYPVRDGASTRWLSEGEVAARYRDRFAARAELTARLERVHEEGAGRLARVELPWLVLSTVPTVSGSRAAGSAAVGRAHGFFASWARRACPLTALTVYGPDGFAALAGVGRVIISAPQPYSGVSHEAHLELHHDGAGFGGVSLVGGQNAQAASQGVAVVRDEVELSAQALVSVLAEHAVDTGAAGELMLRAQLLPVELINGTSGPTELHAASLLGGYVRPAHRVPQTLVLASMGPAVTSSLLAEVAAGTRGSVRAAYPLVAEVLAEFGVSEPGALRPDGRLTLEALDPRYGQRVAGWAAEHGLLETD